MAGICQKFLSIVHELSIPAGSAFLNLFANGCRSRLGSDWTNRNV